MSNLLPMYSDRGKLSARLILIFVTFFCLKTSAQEEHVYLDLDKYTCSQGDTVFIKGYITQGLELSSLSTNLYVNVYSGNGQPLSKYMFPIYHGLSQGQVIFKGPIPTQNYYIVAFTKAQLNYTPLNLFSVPVLVYNKEKPALVYHKKAVEQQNAATAGTIKDITWTTSWVKEELSFQLEADSPATSRHLQIRRPVSTDHGLAKNITLTKKTSLKQGLFPIDSTRDVQTFLLREDSTPIARQFLRISEPRQNITIIRDTFDTSPGGYNSWLIRMPDTLLYNASISVGDADRSIPSPISINTLHNSYTEDLTIPVGQVDTSYLTFKGKALRQTGNALPGELTPEIFFAGVQDSNYLFSKIVPTGQKGDFTLDSLVFFDSLAIQFQLNTAEGARTKDLRLDLTRDNFTMPAVDSNMLQAAWEDDVIAIDQRDTALTKREWSEYEMARMKTLQPAIVRRWKDNRKKLDQTYTSGPFSEPALYSYDLRDYTGEYNRNIIWFINAQGTTLHTSPSGNMLVDAFGHSVHYFVDEVEYDYRELPIVDFDRIAYVKILESDFLSTSRPSFSLVASGSPLSIPVQQTPINVLIYTRKDKDFRSMRGGLNTLFVKGYDKVLPFSPGKRTIFWSPWQEGNTFRIHFNNTEDCQRFRVKISAITPSGHIAFYEQVIPSCDETDPAYQLQATGKKN